MPEKGEIRNITLFYIDKRLPRKGDIYIHQIAGGIWVTRVALSNHSHRRQVRHIVGTIHK